MRFSKWHGLGNEYLLVDRREGGGAIGEELVRRICDPHVGVGSDGVLEILTVEGRRAEIAIWNPDGSRAELSGTGTRIVGRWLARQLSLDAVEVAVGERVVGARVLGELMVEQDMGKVEVGEKELLELKSESVEVIPVSVGNPHAVVQQDPDPAEVARLGPLIEHHDRFPERTNVQLVRVEGTQELAVGVWERGVGLTASSGTSACAAAAAGCARGWVESPVSVSLPGGVLLVSIDGAAATLTGPAQEICRGELSAELLADIGR